MTAKLLFKKVSELFRKICPSVVKWGDIVVTIAFTLITIWGFTVMAQYEPLPLKTLFFGLVFGSFAHEWSGSKRGSMAFQKIALMVGIYFGLDFLTTPSVTNLNWLIWSGAMYTGTKMKEVSSDFKISPVGDPLYYLWAATSLLTVVLRSRMTTDLWLYLALALVIGMVFWAFSSLMEKWGKPIVYVGFVIFCLVTLFTHSVNLAIALLLTGWTISIIQFFIDMFKIIFPPEADS